MAINKEMTPKRKSILWNYDKNGYAYIIGLRTEKTKDLKVFFQGETPCKVDIKGSDGIGVSLNKTGTMIWEKCDGLTSIKEIVNEMVCTYNISNELAFDDVSEFIDYAEKLDILDANWRSIL